MQAEEKKMDDTKKNDKKNTMPGWNRNDCIYTSCFCEENVWNLCDKTRKEGNSLSDYFVIFLSNKKKQFPIWFAKSSSSNDKPVIWDYHVIYLWINRSNPTESLIFDLDTTLSFPCLINEYITKSFRPNMKLKDEYKHNFRVIPSITYLDNFYSDRQHMFVKKKWISTPPNYPCIMIKGKKKGSNLMSHFVNIKNKKFGIIYDDPMKLYQWVTNSK